MQAPPPHGMAERIYAVLLIAYPQAFRQEYREPMLEFFRARRLETQNRLSSRFRFWSFVLRDLTVNAVAAWRDTWKQGVHARRRLNRLSGSPAANPSAPPQHKDRSMDALMQDLRYAVRRLVREPLFTIPAVVIVAIGIGANTAMFTVVDNLLLRPQPWEDADRLVYVYQDSDDGRPSSSSFPAYLDMRAHEDVFAHVTGILTGWSAGWMRDGGAIMQVNMSAVTASYFETLGLTPIVGRAFDADEDQGVGPAVAIISQRTWERELGRDPNAVGQTIRLNGTPVTIVGVGPEGYGGIVPGQNIDFWVSISTLASVQGRFIAGTVDRRSDHWFDVIARLRDGVSVAQAQAAMNVLAERLAREYPQDNADRDITVFAANRVRIHPDADRVMYPAGAVLMGTVGLVLLVACANLANLVIARSSTRGRELAIRAAIGAGRGRIVQHLLLESLVLSAVGGTLGILLAERLVHVVTTTPIGLPIPVNPALAVDARVLLFGIALTLATGLAFGLAPAVGASRPDLVPSLKEGDGGARISLARKKFGLRKILVVTQVAGSLVLLIGAGLLIRSLRNAYAIDLGLETSHLAVMQPNVGQAGYDRERAARFYEELIERVQALPGVEAAGVASRLPLQASNTSTLLFDEPMADADPNGVEVDFAWVGTTYLNTLNVPMLHGRGFTEADLARVNNVAVISETMATRYFGTTDVVGRWFRYESDRETRVEVIGVAADTKVRSAGEPPTAFFYRLLPRGVGNRLYVVARTSQDAVTAAGMLQREVRDMDPSVPVYSVGTMDNHVDTSLTISRTAASLLSGVALFALLLASFGLYAVVTFTVSRRTAEVGIRKALGARGNQVATMLIREVLFLVAIGVGIGILLSVWATPLLDRLLFGVPAIDPVTIAVVTLTLIAVAAGAASMPAVLAARADPVRALRQD